MLGKSLFFIFALLVAVNGDGRIIFRFYHEPTYVTDYNVIDFHTILNHPNFGRTRETVIFHYGAGQTIATPQVHDVITAYASRQQFNFIVVVYDDVATIGTDNANALAAGISSSLINLFDNGYSSGLMNLLGFSLGAQILARSSRQVQNQSSRRHIIGRLTGLDPWSLGPINSITIGTMSSADAQWVESIHTEGAQRGDLESRGHVSFFVNGGVAQPMCTQALPTARWDCSHVFALSVWAESVRTTSLTFASLRCDSWEEFVSGRCNTHEIAYMGRLNSASTLRGSFMLATNMQAPWSRNQAQP
ncbi:lipase member H-B-like [Chironomus tepperi]|uniref:lipase member H-B-like n=1 Tax=Chironomus tepperi TaxID=113505 RepID=UPI00391F984E